jgi:hypothetical protein
MKLKEVGWLRDDKGKYVSNKGKLPLDIRFLDEFLADPTHHAKCGRNKRYALKAMKQGREPGIQQYNCEKISWLMGYFLHCYCHLPLDQFKEKSDCILNHHFGDHSKCSSKWCKLLTMQEGGK